MSTLDALNHPGHPDHDPGLDRNFKEPAVRASLSGGELPAERRAEFLRVRALIQKEDDVHEVLALAKYAGEPRWLYLIQTPFATFPKFVIGSTDADNLHPELLFRCGTEWAAQDEWNRVCELLEMEDPQ